MKQKIQPQLHTPSFTATEGDSTIRFLGLLKQPDSDPNPFELDESEVVWSSDLFDSADFHSQSPSNTSNPPTSSLRRRHQSHHFYPEKSGLSAALSDDHHPLVRRKPTLDPSVSAASAARTIPPVALHRSGVARTAGKVPQSAPVNVPVWPTRARDSGASNLENFDEVEEEMVPPHEMVARSHMTTFSVFEGVGRTLKGRDLRQVRNAVFQKTGFID